jgi:hypothetical protein
VKVSLIGACAEKVVRPARWQKARIDFKVDEHTKQSMTTSRKKGKKL